jgi:hypothetical protein
MAFISNLGNSKIDMERIANNFPITANVILVERVLGGCLLAFGVIVALALLLTHDSKPVMVAKMYLVANVASTLVLAILSLMNDLPDPNRTTVIVEQFAGFVVTSLVCTVWFLYFSRSTRVYKTYLEPKYGKPLG